MVVGSSSSSSSSSIKSSSGSISFVERFTTKTKMSKVKQTVRDEAGEPGHGRVSDAERKGPNQAGYNFNRAVLMPAAAAAATSTTITTAANANTYCRCCCYYYYYCSSR